MNLRDRLESAILEKVEAADANGKGAPRVPNTSNIYFDYIEGEETIDDFLEDFPTVSKPQVLELLEHLKGQATRPTKAA